ncbi:MAG: aminotransferase class V-fold PLP-dependent enzyme [Acaryochloridaceae cyanobacterium RU_4_10]|nr:aminotransferase class V-fold PLP-dependent enzyme [Acaryochloridaceae cyanobacterium RU_4_10]
MSHSRKEPIYMDGHATTRVDPQVVEAMLPYLSDRFGNPSSQSHGYGWEAAAAVKQARQILADAIAASSEEIVFTSGATEANNLAIKGVAEANLQRGRHLITLQTEHRAVLEPCQYLERLGFEVTYLPVQGDGLIDLQQLQASLRPDTILVSVMAANSEIGVLQPLAEIGAICHAHQVLFHTDAAQAIAKIPLDVQTSNIDLMSLTAHKVYGPKGIGALYIRRKNPRVQLAPQIHGGEQERGFRSGTLATHQIVGFAKAIELGLAEQPQESERLRQLRDRLYSRLQTLEGIYLNGHPTQRLPGSLNISVEGVDGAALLLTLRSQVALSSGSACASGRAEPSPVLIALGRDKALASASLRFGIGRFNTLDEVDFVTEQVAMSIQSLRRNHTKA